MLCSCCNCISETPRGRGSTTSPQNLSTHGRCFDKLLLPTFGARQGGPRHSKSSAYAYRRTEKPCAHISPGFLAFATRLKTSHPREQSTPLGWSCSRHSKSSTYVYRRPEKPCAHIYPDGLAFATRLKTSHPREQSMPSGWSHSTGLEGNARASKAENNRPPHESSI
jgi:hypothetical protein